MSMSSTPGPVIDAGLREDLTGLHHEIASEARARAQLLRDIGHPAAAAELAAAAVRLGRREPDLPEPDVDPWM